MEPAVLMRAVEACQAVAKARGLLVDDSVVLNNSNRLAVHLRPCDVLAPHFLDRVDEAVRLVDDATNNPEIAGADRELLATTLRTTSRAIIGRGAPEQLLHGEPHAGNVVRTSEGLLFVDLETCCRGPIEFDIAHAADDSRLPTDVAAHYAGVDQALVRQCWMLMLAMVTAWRASLVTTSRTGGPWPGTGSVSSGPHLRPEPEPRCYEACLVGHLWRAHITGRHRQFNRPDRALRTGRSRRPPSEWWTSTGSAFGAQSSSYVNDPLTGDVA